MGRYRRVKKSKPTGEVATPVAGRKRKASSSDEFVERQNSTDVVTAEKVVASTNSDEQLASSVSSDGLVELVNDTSKLVDLEVKVKEETVEELETCRERRETTPLPNEVLLEEAEIMKFYTPPSTPAPATTPIPPPAPAPARVVRLSGENSRRQVTALQFDPAEAELEEFFAKFEADNKAKNEEFAKRYNFDIENDKPLEGRFKWEKIEP